MRMYDTTAVFDITKDKVLRFTTEYDIFAQYMGFSPVVGHLYTSPLRKDNNPSFGLFFSKTTNKLMFKDFGTGETGDCFTLAKLMDGKNLKHILRDLYKQYVSNKVTKRKVKTIPVKVSKDLEIIIDEIPFTEEGLAFWNSFGINLTTLSKYNVSQIRKFWVDGMEYWYAPKNKPMFAYQVYSKYKIYRPMYKQKRFYTNCTSVDVQGWEQLDYSKDTVIITKSLKDVMLLHELGYAAIAPNGEGHSIPKKALKILRENFKRIVVLYDRDWPGMIASRKLVTKNPDFDFFFMPRKTSKDLSDYYLKYGKEASIKLLSEKLNDE